MHAHRSSAAENFAPTGICVSEGAVKVPKSTCLLRVYILNVNMMQYILSKVKLV